MAKSLLVILVCVLFAFVPEAPHQAADTPGGTEGVVPHDSAHLEGAASERIVRSDHGVHAHPVAIQGVKRILRELLVKIDHARQTGKMP